MEKRNLSKNKINQINNSKVIKNEQILAFKKSNMQQMEKNYTEKYTNEINNLTNNLNEIDLNNNKNINSIQKYKNKNFDENFNEINTIQTYSNQNKYSPDAPVVLKVSKTTEKEQMDLFKNSLGNKSEIELFNTQLANMQKDAIVKGIKQNKMSLGLKVMMDNEKIHAEEAMESGIYITWCSKDVKFNKK